MQDELKFSCPCHFGLESTLSFEIKKIGGQNVTVTDGKVTFTGDISMAAKANINLRTAERVFIVLKEFKAVTFDELFDNVKEVEIEKYVGKSDKFPVKGHSINSALFSISDCQSIIKKALVERLKVKYKVNWLEETGVLYQVCFFIHKDIVSIMLDTTGPGLHKRGYRRESIFAPIKETLAAGMVDVARIYDDSLIIDPFCGSGTILIESALKAMNIAPGVNRKFISQTWDLIPSVIWEREKESARSLVKNDVNFKAIGYDIDENALKLTLANAKKAGVREKISVKKADVRSFSYPERKSIIITNPPYGKRLLEQKDAQELYKIMGEKMLPSHPNHIHIITPDEEFENLFGKKADKNRKLYNGMIMCRLYSYFK